MCINCNLPMPLPETVIKYLQLPPNSLSSTRNVREYFNSIKYDDLKKQQKRRLKKYFGKNILIRIAKENRDKEGLLKLVSGDCIISRKFDNEMQDHYKTFNTRTIKNMTIIDKKVRTVSTCNSKQKFKYIIGEWVQLPKEIQMKNMEYLLSLWDDSLEKKQSVRRIQKFFRTHMRKKYEASLRIHLFKNVSTMCSRYII